MTSEQFTWPAIADQKFILITVPNMHWISRYVVHSLLRLQQDRRYRLTIMLPSNKPYENNLHHIVNDFMAGDYNFWLNIDADNPPQNNPLDLVELDKDIIGLPTPIWYYTGDKKGERPIYENVYKYIPKKDVYAEWQVKEGLQEVDAVGTGCILIARRVFENPEMRKAPFERKLNKDGTVNKGNDISFSERAKKNGFSVYAHYGYRCDHLCENSLDEIGNAFRNLYE